MRGFIGTFTGKCAMLVIASMCMTSVSFAGDRVTLKNGKVLEGTVERKESGFVVMLVKRDGKETREFIDESEVSKIEKDVSTPAPAAAPAAAPASAPAAAPTKATSPAAGATPVAEAEKDKKEAEPAAKAAGSATRVAILNFGPPSQWMDKAGNMVGVEISATAFRDVIPMLKADKTDVVVIRVNSGGGYSLEMARLSKLYEEQYIPQFRTVGWIESAISAAAMAPWILREFVFMSHGNMGGCTEFSGGLVASKGIRLEEVLFTMEKISDKANRDKLIMRSMQIQQPLSMDIDENNNRVFYGNLQGQHIINPGREVLTANAEKAKLMGLSKGTADTKEELVKVLELKEVEWVGQKAATYIDEFMLKASESEKRFREFATGYLMALDAARGLPAGDPRRAGEIGRARTFLSDMKRRVAQNPNFTFHFAGNVGALMDDDWFTEQERILRQLAAPPRQAPPGGGR